MIITTFVIGAYFTSKVAQSEVIGTHQWGNAMALAGIIIAILSPIFGAIADYHGRRKYWLLALTFLVIISSALLWYAYPSKTSVNFTLACVIAGTIGFSVSMVFYNALLPHLAPANYVGRISGWGWGSGYFGGLSILLIAFYGFVNAKHSWLNTAAFEQVRICGPLVALWVMVFTLPLFFAAPDYSSKRFALPKAIYYGIKDLGVTLKTLSHQKNIFVFLLSQMIYIDGLNTLFAFGGIYAAGVFHMALSEVLLLGIAMNVFAGVGCVLFAWVDDWIGSKVVILLSLMALIFLGLGIVLTTNKTVFWSLACTISLFVGPVQSSTRSLMARLVPKEKTTEMFGLYVLSGKISTFLGPWLLGAVTLHFNSQRVGMGAILGFFVVGAFVLRLVHSPDINKNE